jgi:prepilin-type N-terminal cleavage/methylation domain-containing protein
LKPSNDRGFTIVEVLIAMVILTIALVSMAELMAITLRMQMLGRNQTAAARLAQDKIDELMNQNFTTNASVFVGGSLDDDVANFFDEPTDSDGNTLGYKRRWQVAAGPIDDKVQDAINAGTLPANPVRILTVRIIPVVNDLRTSLPVDVTTLLRCWPC